MIALVILWKSLQHTGEGYFDLEQRISEAALQMFSPAPVMSNF
jgi:hypothetical protein